MPTVSQPLPPVAMPSALPTFGLPAAAPNATATLSPEHQNELLNYAMGGPKTPLAIHAPWLTHLFAGVFLVSAVLLVILLAVQTTKQESLGGGMSGRSESFRPRLGLEGQLARATQAVAVFFVLSATLVSISGI